MLNNNIIYTEDSNQVVIVQYVIWANNLNLAITQTLYYFHPQHRQP